MRKPEQGNMCFGCGKDNPVGLKLDFQWDGDLFWGKFIPREEHQGYPGITHGGIIATVLDEVMSAILFDQDIPVVTAEMTVRYIHKIPIGEETRLYSRQLSQHRRLHEIEGWIQNDEGTIFAKGYAKMLAVKK